MPLLYRTAAQSSPDAATNLEMGKSESSATVSRSLPDSVAIGVANEPTLNAQTPEAPALAEPVKAPRADDTVKDAVKTAQRAVAAFPID